MKRMVAGILVMLTLLGMTGCAPLDVYKRQV